MIGQSKAQGCVTFLVSTGNSVRLARTLAKARSRHDIVATNIPMVKVDSSGVIDAPIEKLWDLVSDFNNVGRWHPDVTESRLESGSGKDAGSVRAIRLRNGMSIRERLARALAQGPLVHLLGPRVALTRV
jgi:Polyketide cyclase / dehydrase and lipid transport